MHLGLWSGLPLCIKLLFFDSWRETNTSCWFFGCTTRRPRQQEHFFWIGSIGALSLKIRITLPVRNCLSSSSDFNPWAPRTLWVQHQVCWSDLVTLTHVSTLASRLGGHKTFKAQYTWYSMEMMASTRDENPNKQNIMNGYTIKDLLLL